jgi:4-amino-4-deoxy-L-arabinose transferase-like glycosyltransferase
VQEQEHNRASWLRRNYLFFVLFALAGAIAGWKYVELAKILPMWDAYSFLLNALTFAGRDFAYFEKARAPLLPFLVSLAFRAGYVQVEVIMLIDAAFAVAGALLMYALVRRKYDQGAAFLAGLFFICPMVMVDWIAQGYADIASITLSVAAVACFVKGVDGDPRWHLLSWPLLMLAFLSRNTAALAGAPMVYYYVAARKDYDDLWWHTAGVALAGALYLPVALFFRARLGDPLYYVNTIISGFGKSSVSTGASGDIYDPSRWYFLDHFRESFFEPHAHYVVVIAIMLGLLALIVRYIKGAHIEFTGTFPIIFFFFVFYYVLSNVSFLRGQMVLMVIMFVLIHYAKKTPRGAFFGMLVLWMLSYFLFHSLYYQKVVRYYTTMLPGFAALSAISVYALAEALRGGARYKRAWTGIVVSSVALALVFSAYISVSDTYEGSSAVANAEAMAVATFLQGSVPDYEEALYYSDDWVFTAWHAMTPMYAMPFFEDYGSFEHQLQKYGVDYYITYRGPNFPTYKEVFHRGETWVLQRQEVVEKPRFLFIGAAWENYLEPLLGFEYYLIDGGKEIEEWSDYVDDYAIDELLAYDFVALYQFKWHDLSKAEALLDAYVASGGTLVVDCSGNDASFGYKLDGYVFLDTNIIRAELTSESVIDPEDVREEYTFSSFVYGDGSWYGDTYLPVAAQPDLHVYAYVEDTMLMAMETRGEGRILWIGYNYVFHAFDNKNTSEARLLQEAFEDIAG